MAEYIEREELRNAVKQKTFTKYAWSDEIDFDDFEKVLDGLPAADVAPVRHGRWVPVYESEISGWNPEYAGYDPVGDYRCSLCGKDAILDCNDELVVSPYCPGCGAQMDGGKE